MDCSDSEVFLKDLNIYEESSCKGIYVLKIVLKNKQLYLGAKRRAFQVIRKITTNNLHLVYGFILFW